MDDVRSTSYDKDNSLSTREVSLPRIRCPVCHDVYKHHLCIFKCERCETPFCEICKWKIDICQQCGNDLSNATYRHLELERTVRSEWDCEEEGGYPFRMDDDMGHEVINVCDTPPVADEFWTLCASVMKVD